jgi:predicted amidophosphoribosyltransferase
MEVKEKKSECIVISIGLCAHCERRAKLTQELCTGCHEALKDFGKDGWKKEFGQIMRVCRKNPKLAKLVYDGLQRPEAKRMFAQKFGIIED